MIEILRVDFEYIDNQSKGSFNIDSKFLSLYIYLYEDPESAKIGLENSLYTTTEGNYSRNIDCSMNLCLYRNGSGDIARRFLWGNISIGLTLISIPQSEKDRSIEFMNNLSNAIQEHLLKCNM